MKKILITLLVLGASLSAMMAQNDIQLTQQIYNRNLFNPAATGQSGCWNVSLLARQQWTGFTGRPSTQMLNVNRYFKGYKLGIGLSVINDKLGAEASQNVKASIAYHAWLSQKAVLSFGLGIGLLNKSINGNILTYENANDPNAYISKKSEMKPDFDFGMEFNMGGLNIGAASTHLFTGLKKSATFKVPRHFYLYAKYAFNVSNAVEITPSISLNNIGKINLLEINVTTMIKNRVWAGISYRLDDAIAFIAGVKIIKQLSLGYSYDYSLGAIRGYCGGTHEIMLIGKFGCSPTSKFIVPRFFN